MRWHNSLIISTYLFSVPQELLQIFILGVRNNIDVEPQYFTET